jgi:cob(I)alamin adenosyltransferase
MSRKKINFHAAAMAAGDLDELNAWIGVLREEYFDIRFSNGQYLFSSIQKRLILLRQEILGKEKLDVEERCGCAKSLRETISHIDEPLLNLKEDDLLPAYPGDLHLARAVCNRTMRSLSRLFHKTKKEPKGTFEFLDALQTFLFVYARVANKEYSEEIGTTV